MRPSDAEALAAVARLVPLLREINNLKRIRVAGKSGSWAERLFSRAWCRLIAGEEATRVALEECALAVAATLLAGIDDGVLEAGGIGGDRRREIFRRAFDSAAQAVEPDFARRLSESFAQPRPKIPDTAVVPPAFVAQLAAQPRAGATRPGYPRVVLEPAENHAEHCAVVAVTGVLTASCFGADPGTAFLTGLSHHLHNALLPDAGDAGDKMLGDSLAPLIETFRALAIGELPAGLRDSVSYSLEAVFRADYQEAKAFQAADSIDRVLEMEWHAQTASFTLAVALNDMDIIHPGPVQNFQLEVMRSLGLES